MMIIASKLVDSALECLGWPYESPGSNDEKGIDCSGLWVRAFQAQGGYIYHGSNTIFRKYCTETGKLTSASQLQVGMAVFKRKDWTDSETDKKNKWYGSEPGNLYHIGMVTSVNPLVITHATTPVCKQDFKIGNWTYWGKVKGVDYSGSADPAPVKVSGKTMYVYAASGETVNFRSGPSSKKSRIARIPVGDQLTVYESQGNWSRAEWKGKSGWIMTKYLSETKIKPTVLPGTSATVWSENGKPVKLRNRPSASSSLYDEIPINTMVTLAEYGDVWCKVNYGHRHGWYIMTKFLSWG